jgi:hypothetical protein
MRMYSLVSSPDGSPGSPSGGLGTVPRIVSPDGSSDSPPGGLWIVFRIVPPDGSSDSPPGGLWTVFRIVPPDGSSDSPSGGPQNLGRSLGQPFGRHTRTAPWAKRTKLRPLYGVAHIRCHLSGRASPSRTSSHRNPDSLSALRNYFAGREREARQVYGMCMRARDECLGSPLHSFYRKTKG